MQTPAVVYNSDLDRGIYRDCTGRLVVVYSYAAAHEVRTLVDNKIYALQHPENRGYWFRCTNNRKEDEICNNLVSHNHADGTAEIGMSVSEHPGYQIFGYQYIYVVSGDVIGHGSDGEPLLANVKALSKPAKSLSAKWLKRYQQDCVIPGLSDEEIKALTLWHVERPSSYDFANITDLAPITTF